MEIRRLFEQEGVALSLYAYWDARKNGRHVSRLFTSSIMWFIEGFKERGNYV